MGPGKEPKQCSNEELVYEFELACQSGDYEFADEYKTEIIKRLKNEQLKSQIIELREKLITTRFRLSKQNNENLLMQQRNDKLERALDRIITRTKGYEAHTNESNIHYIAYSTKHEN